MPIRADLRHLYGSEWRKLRAALIKQHGPNCRACGRECLAYLNLCHLQHDPRLPLVELRCASCHARYDAPTNHALARRTRARKVGQLWLLPDIEFAPVALADIPEHVLRELRRCAQRGLFD